MRKRKPKEIEIIYHYVGDDSPEKKKEAEKKVDELFDYLFDQTFKYMREKKQKEQQLASTQPKGK